MTSNVPHHVLAPRFQLIAPPHPARVTLVSVSVTSYTAPIAATDITLHLDSGRRKSIRFEYSMAADNSQQLSGEMGQALGLTEDDVQLLCTALEREIEPYRTAWNANER